MLKEYLHKLMKYHFENLYNESDPKKHEDYYRNFYYEMEYDDLIDTYKNLMARAGSWTSANVGELNAVIWWLNEKYPNWRNK